jgi:glycosyltransferase involved in cell wall biosynthesis
VSETLQRRLLVLSRYERNAASSRLRTRQYQPYLEAVGFDVGYAAFFDAAYLDRLYAGQRSPLSIARYYLGRARMLLPRPRVDLIWMEYEAFPYLPFAAERLFLPAGIPLVSDYDDAVFHRYDQHRLSPVRALLGDKIDRIMAASRLVTAGNDYLAERARHAGASRVEIVPTVLDAQAYQVRPAPLPGASVVIGWVGSPSTWQLHARPLLPMLDELVRDGMACHIVGAHVAEERAGFSFLPWAEETEVEMIRRMDIGIMPLPADSWARGKCGYKLIQYMACGLPVVASPVGVNSQIVEHGVNGFLASSAEEWIAALRTLARNSELRMRMGQAGRKKVEQHYSIQVEGPRVAALLRAVADEKS